MWSDRPKVRGLMIIRLTTLLFLLAVSGAALRAEEAPPSGPVPDPTAPRVQLRVRVVEPARAVTLQLRRWMSLEPPVHHARVIDLNGDGRSDAVLASDASLLTLVTGPDGASAPARATRLGFEPSALHAGDLDGDGSPDVLLYDRADRVLAVAWMKSGEVERIDRVEAPDGQIQAGQVFRYARGARSAVAFLLKSGAGSHLSVLDLPGRAPAWRTGGHHHGDLSALRVGDLGAHPGVEAITYDAEKKRTLSVQIDAEGQLGSWQPGPTRPDPRFDDTTLGLSVIGDFDVPGVPRLLIPLRDGTWRVASLSPRGGLWGRELMSTPEYMVVSERIAGDFDGDWITDIVVRGERGRTFHVALSSRIENRSIDLPAGEWATRHCRALGSGDFEGAGAEQVLGICEWNGQRELTLAHFVGVRGLPQAVLSVDGETVETDASGAAEVELSAVMGPVLPLGQYLPSNQLRPADLSGRTALTFVRQPRDVTLTLHGLVREHVFEPSVCVGYNPDGYRVWGETPADCPRGYGALAADDPTAAVSRATTQARVLCCPLPAKDILTDVHSESESICEDGYVVTGGVASYCETCVKKLRCTKLNTARYQLGPPIAGAYWGSGLSMFPQFSRLNKAAVPPALRFGLGRLGESYWDEDGCVPDRYGALLTSKSDGSCSSYIFRELQYSGTQPGDPPAGTPVKVLPDCVSISSPFDRYPRCITEQGPAQ